MADTTTHPALSIPTTFVILGATGDLVSRKIAPALFDLFGKNLLPSRFKVLGFSRRDLNTKTFRTHLRAVLRPQPAHGEYRLAVFLSLFTYLRGDAEKPDSYPAIAQALGNIDRQLGVCSNKLFYLAMPPQFYKTIFENLSASGLTKGCDPDEGWTRVIVEKPFGNDLRTAEELDALLGSLFKEEQIYRIDHYLAKEMLQNILSFRFQNNLFEDRWDRNAIERVNIHLWETLGVEHRGSFYDNVGALKDVGQNHLLQMLALTTMEAPLAFTAKDIRAARAQILKALRLPRAEDVPRDAFRAQYSGYRAIQNIRPGSTTETFFRITTFLDTPRWQGVPFVLESGKRLKEQRKEIEILFRHPSPCLCDPGSKEHYKNRIVISFEPEERITIDFWAKRAGFDFKVESRELSFLLRPKRTAGQYIEEYEKLLLDCILGDQTLFVNTEEVKAMWQFVDPILNAWKKDTAPLPTYAVSADPRKLGPLQRNISAARMTLQKRIGIIGLGKMGGNISRRLIKFGWDVHGYSASTEEMTRLKAEGMKTAPTLKELVRGLPAPHIIWLMVPSGDTIDEILFGKEGVTPHLHRGDFIIDAGNSFYKDAVRREKKLGKNGIHFVDVGVSGGPSGALNGAALMIGGTKMLFEKLEPLFADLSVVNGYQFFEGIGAGHFVKMIHNGIEYGMMQALAEGFSILKKSDFALDLSRVTDVYNHGSVIESRLVGWLEDAFTLYGEELKNISGVVGHTGEGTWTVEAARTLRLKTKVIEEALKFRIASQYHPDYTGRLLSALRNQFGGHKVTA